ncbi:hypothetical protein LDG_7633 [Legionella drancourtii LLAP12]|uniref:Uncharacterized protein n=1 Tax=Legionella drancourtii LLAP12 TaxID=658187 RepID=G9EQT0_9GAMM|nr:hypothetical protein LDG_7633 [Legionella drancourtii LLAP12]
MNNLTLCAINQPKDRVNSLKNKPPCVIFTQFFHWFNLKTFCN